MAKQQGKAFFLGDLIKKGLKGGVTATSSGVSQEEYEKAAQGADYLADSLNAVTAAFEEQRKENERLQRELKRTQAELDKTKKAAKGLKAVLSATTQEAPPTPKERKPREPRVEKEKLVVDQEQLDFEKEAEALLKRQERNTARKLAVILQDKALFNQWLVQRRLELAERRKIVAEEEEITEEEVRTASRRITKEEYKAKEKERKAPPILPGMTIDEAGIAHAKKLKEEEKERLRLIDDYVAKNAELIAIERRAGELRQANELKARQAAEENKKAQQQQLDASLAFLRASEERETSIKEELEAVQKLEQEYNNWTVASQKATAKVGLANLPKFAPESSVRSQQAGGAPTFPGMMAYLRTSMLGAVRGQAGFRDYGEGSSQILNIGGAKVDLSGEISKVDELVVEDIEKWLENKLKTAEGLLERQLAKTKDPGKQKGYIARFKEKSEGYVKEAEQRLRPPVELREGKETPTRILSPEDVAILKTQVAEIDRLSEVLYNEGKAFSSAKEAATALNTVLSSLLTLQPELIQNSEALANRLMETAKGMGRFSELTRSGVASVKESLGANAARIRALDRSTEGEQKYAGAVEETSKTLEKQEREQRIRLLRQERMERQRGVAVAFTSDQLKKLEESQWAALKSTGSVFEEAQTRAIELGSSIDDLDTVIEALKKNRGPVELGQEIEKLEKKIERVQSRISPKAGMYQQKIETLEGERQGLLAAGKGDSKEYDKVIRDLDQVRARYGNLTKPLEKHKADLASAREEQEKLNLAMSKLSVEKFPEAGGRVKVLEQLQKERRGIESLKEDWVRLKETVGSRIPVLQEFIQKLSGIRQNLASAIGGKFSKALFVDLLKFPFEKFRYDLDALGDQSDTSAGRLSRLGDSIRKLLERMGALRPAGEVFVDLARGAEGFQRAISGTKFTQMMLPGMSGLGGTPTLPGTASSLWGATGAPLSYTTGVAAAGLSSLGPAGGIPSLRQTLGPRPGAQLSLPFESMKRFGEESKKTAVSIEVVTENTRALIEEVQKSNKLWMGVEKLGKAVQLGLPGTEPAKLTFAQGMFQQMDEEAESLRNHTLEIGVALDQVAVKGKKTQLSLFPPGVDNPVVRMVEAGKRFSQIAIPFAKTQDEIAKESQSWFSRMAQSWGVGYARLEDIVGDWVSGQARIWDRWEARAKGTSQVWRNLTSLWAGKAVQLKLPFEGVEQDISGFKDLFKVVGINLKTAFGDAWTAVSGFTIDMAKATRAQGEFVQAGERTKAAVLAIRDATEQARRGLREAGKGAPLASFTQDMKDARILLKGFGGDTEKLKAIMASFKKTDLLPKQAIKETESLLKTFGVKGEVQEQVAQNIAKLFSQIRSGETTASEASETLQEFYIKLGLIGEAGNRSQQRMSTYFATMEQGIKSQDQLYGRFGISSRNAWELAAKGAKASFKDIFKSASGIGVQFANAFEEPLSIIRNAFRKTGDISDSSLTEMGSGAKAASTKIEGLSASVKDLGGELTKITPQMREFLEKQGWTPEQINKGWKSFVGPTKEWRGISVSALEAKRAGGEWGAFSPFGRTPSADLVRMADWIKTAFVGTFRAIASGAIITTAATVGFGKVLWTLGGAVKNVVFSMNMLKLALAGVGALFRVTWSVIKQGYSIFAGFLSFIGKLPGIIKSVAGAIASTVGTIFKIVTAPAKWIMAPLNWIGDFAGVITSAFRRAYYAIFNIRTLLLTTGLGLFFRNIAQAATEFEQGMAKAASVAGATEEEFSTMTETAREMGRTTIYSAKDAATAFYSLASAGLTAKESMQALQPVMLLAGATGEELNFTAETLTSSMRAFGMQATEVTRISNLFAQVIATSPATLGRMAYSMKYTAGMTKAFGWQIEDTAASIGLLHRAGFFGEQAGVALRAALVRLARPMEMTMEGMRGLGLSVSDLDPTLNSMADILETLEKHQENVFRITQIVGQEALPALLAMIRQGSKAWKEYRAELIGTQKATEQYATMIGTVRNQYARFMNALTDLRIALFAPFVGVARSLFNVLAEAIGEMAKTIDMNRIGITRAVEKMAGSFGSFLRRMITSTADFIDHMRPIGRILWGWIKGPVEAFLKLPAYIQAGGLLATLILGPRRVFNISAIIALMDRFSGQIKIGLREIGKYIEDYLVGPITKLIDKIGELFASIKKATGSASDVNRAQIIRSITALPAAQRALGLTQPFVGKGVAGDYLTMPSIQRFMADMVPGIHAEEAYAEGQRIYQAIRQLIKDLENPETRRSLNIPSTDLAVLLAKLPDMKRWVEAVDAGADAAELLQNRLRYIAGQGTDIFIQSGPHAGRAVESLPEGATRRYARTGMLAELDIIRAREDVVKSLASSLAKMDREFRVDVARNIFLDDLRERNIQFSKFTEVLTLLPESWEELNIGQKITALEKAIATIGLVAERGGERPFSSGDVKTISYHTASATTGAIELLAGKIEADLYREGNNRSKETQDMLQRLFPSTVRPSAVIAKSVANLSGERAIQTFAEAIKKGIEPETARGLAVLASMGEEKGLPAFNIVSGHRTPEWIAQKQKDWDEGRREGLAVRPVTDSSHLKDIAADLVITSGNFKEVMEAYGKLAPRAGLRGAFVPGDLGHFVKTTAGPTTVSAKDDIMSFIRERIVNILPEEFKSLAPKIWTNLASTAKDFMDEENLGLIEAIKLAYSRIEKEFPEGFGKWLNEKVFGIKDEDAHLIKNTATKYLDMIAGSLAYSMSDFKKKIGDETDKLIVEPMFGGWAQKAASARYIQLAEEFNRARKQARAAIEKGGEFKYTLGGEQKVEDFGLGLAMKTRLGTATQAEIDKVLDLVLRLDKERAEEFRVDYQKMISSTLGSMGARFAVGPALFSQDESKKKAQKSFIDFFRIDAKTEVEAKDKIADSINSVMRAGLFLALQQAPTKEAIKDLFSDTFSPEVSGLVLTWNEKFLEAAQTTSRQLERVLRDSGLMTATGEAFKKAAQSLPPELLMQLESFLGPHFYEGLDDAKIKKYQQAFQDLLDSVREGGFVFDAFHSEKFLSALKQGEIDASALSETLDGLKTIARDFPSPEAMMGRAILDPAHWEAFNEIRRDLKNATEQARWFGIEQEKMALRARILEKVGVQPEHVFQWKYTGAVLMEQFDKQKVAEFTAEVEKERMALQAASDLTGKYGMALAEAQARQELFNRGIREGSELFKRLYDRMKDLQAMRMYYDFINQMKQNYIELGDTLDVVYRKMVTIAEQQKQAIVLGGVKDLAQQFLTDLINQFDKEDQAVFRVRLSAKLNEKEIQDQIDAVKIGAVTLFSAGKPEEATRLLVEDLRSIFSNIIEELKQPIKEPQLEEWQKIRDYLQESGTYFGEAVSRAADRIEEAGEHVAKLWGMQVSLVRERAGIPVEYQTGPSLAARGGKIPGGFGGGDTVPAMLEPGEFVMRKEAVRKYGLDKMFAMNAVRAQGGGAIPELRSFDQKEFDENNRRWAEFYKLSDMAANRELFWSIYIPHLISSAGGYGLGHTTPTQQMNAIISRNAPASMRFPVEALDFIRETAPVLTQAATKTYGEMAVDILKERRLAPRDLINQITEGEAVALITRGQGDVAAKHVLEGIAAGRITKTEAEDSIVNDVMGVVSRATKTGGTVAEGVARRAAEGLDQFRDILETSPEEFRAGGLVQSIAHLAAGGLPVEQMFAPEFEQAGYIARRGILASLADLAEVSGYKKLSEGLLRMKEQIELFDMATMPFGMMQMMKTGLTPIEKKYLQRTNRGHLATKLEALEEMYGGMYIESRGGDVAMMGSPASLALGHKYGFRFSSLPKSMQEREFNLGIVKDWFDLDILPSSLRDPSVLGTPVRYNPVKNILSFRSGKNRTMGNYHIKNLPEGKVSTELPGAIELSTFKHDPSLTVLGHEARHSWQDINWPEAMNQYLTSTSQRTLLEEDAIRYSEFITKAIEKIVPFIRNLSDAEELAFQRGGPIPGFGGGDSIPALLEPGEFVLNKDAVKKYGLDTLFAMNAVRLTNGTGSASAAAIPKVAGGPLAPNINLGLDPEKTTGAIQNLTQAMWSLFTALTSTKGVALGMGKAMEEFGEQSASTGEMLERMWGRESSAAAAAARIQSVSGRARLAAMNQLTQKQKLATGDTLDFDTALQATVKEGTKGIRDLVQAFSNLPTAVDPADFEKAMATMKMAFDDASKSLPGITAASQRDIAAAYEEGFGLISQRQTDNTTALYKKLGDKAIAAGADEMSIKGIIFQKEQAMRAQSIQQQTAYYQEWANVLGNFASKGQELYAEGTAANRAFAKMSIIMNTASAVMQALGSAPPPFSYALAAMAVAMGAKQLAAIGESGGAGGVGGGATGEPATHKTDRTIMETSGLFSEGKLSGAIGSDGFKSLSTGMQKLTKAVYSLEGTISKVGRFTAAALVSAKSPEALRTTDVLDLMPFARPPTELSNIGAGAGAYRGFTMPVTGPFGELDRFLDQLKLSWISDITNVIPDFWSGLGEGIFGGGEWSLKALTVQMRDLTGAITGYTPFAPIGSITTEAKFKREGGWFSGDETKKKRVENEEVRNAFDEAFRNIETFFDNMGEVLGFDARKLLSDFTDGIALNIDIKGKTGEEISKALQEWFGGAVNQIVAHVTEDLGLNLAEFSKEGEEATQTLVRMTTDLLNLDAAFKQAGTAIDRLIFGVGQIGLTSAIGDRLTWTQNLIDELGGNADATIELLGNFAKSAVGEFGVLGNNVQIAQKMIQDALQSVGIFTATGPDMIRVFQEAFDAVEAQGELTPEIAAQWVLAGNALGVYTEAFDSYNGALSEFQDILDKRGLSEYRKSLYDLEKKYSDTMDSMKRDTVEWATVAAAKAEELAQLEKDHLESITDTMKSFREYLAGGISEALYADIQDVTNTYEDAIDQLIALDALSVENQADLSSWLNKKLLDIQDKYAEERIQKEEELQQKLLGVFSGLWDKTQSWWEMELGKTTFQQIRLQGLYNPATGTGQLMDYFQTPEIERPGIEYFFTLFGDWMDLYQTMTQEQIDAIWATAEDIANAQKVVADNIRSFFMDQSKAPGGVSIEFMKAEFARLRGLATAEGAKGEQKTALADFALNTFLPFMRTALQENSGAYQKIVQEVVYGPQGLAITTGLDSATLKAANDPMLSAMEQQIDLSIKANDTIIGLLGKIGAKTADPELLSAIAGLTGEFTTLNAIQTIAKEKLIDIKTNTLDPNASVVTAVGEVRLSTDAITAALEGGVTGIMDLVYGQVLKTADMTDLLKQHAPSNPFQWLLEALQKEVATGERQGLRDQLESFETAESAAYNRMVGLYSDWVARQNDVTLSYEKWMGPGGAQAKLVALESQLKPAGPASYVDILSALENLSGWRNPKDYLVRKDVDYRALAAFDIANLAEKYATDFDIPENALRTQLRQTAIMQPLGAANPDFYTIDWTKAASTIKDFLTPVKEAWEEYNTSDALAQARIAVTTAKTAWDDATAAADRAKISFDASEQAWIAARATAENFRVSLENLGWALERMTYNLNKITWGQVGVGQTSINVTPPAFAAGAWNVGSGGGVLSILHPNEMVIRAEDAPAVRQFLQSTGAASKYAGSSVSSIPSFASGAWGIASSMKEILRSDQTKVIPIQALQTIREVEKIFSGVQSLALSPTDLTPRLDIRNTLPATGTEDRYATTTQQMPTADEIGRAMAKHLLAALAEAGEDQPDRPIIIQIGSKTVAEIMTSELRRDSNLIRAVKKAVGG